jgi:thymidylate kinase
MEPDLKGLILEGTAGTGKTSILRTLLACPVWTRRPQISSLVLSEHHTMRVLEGKRSIGKVTRQDHLDILNSIVVMLEDLNYRLEAMDWARRNRINQQMHFVLERFHLSHLFHFTSLEWEDVASIDRRLADLNARLIVLTMDESTMQRRIMMDSNKQWQSYLQSIGSTEAEVITHFMGQQEQLLALCERTAIPVRIIDTSALPLETATEEVMRHFLGDPT